MKETRRNEITVGLTVLAGLMILAVGMTTFKECSYSQAEQRLRMRFPESAGLQVGDIVTFNGVKSGRVDNITLEQYSVLVDAVLDDPVMVTVDARPVIQMLELMGGKKIEIRQGVGRPSTDQDVLQGSVDPDISGALGMLGEIRGDVKTMTRDASSLLATASRELSDTVLYADLRSTVSNVRSITNDMRHLLRMHAADITHISRNAVNITAKTDSLIDMLSPRIDASLGSAQQVMLETDSLVSDLRAMIADVRSSRGLFNAAVYDTTLVPRLTRMMERVDTLTSVIVDGQMRIRIRL
jgi:ABC-type transporter Mla subunit MlaD